MSGCNCYGQIDAYVPVSMRGMTTECGRVACTPGESKSMGSVWVVYRVRCTDTALVADKVMSCRVIEEHSFCQLCALRSPRGVSAYLLGGSEMLGFIVDGGRGEGQ